MKILITGIHGFVGSNLVQALQSHHTLYGLDIVSPQASGIVSTYPWDALQDIPPVNTIFHLAGKAHDTKNTSSAQSYFDVNLGLTQKIFDYFLQSDARKFILFSSVKAAADTVTGDFLTEDVPPDPKTPYGQSKLAAERYIQSRKPEAGRRKSEVGSRKSEVGSPISDLWSPISDLRPPTSDLRPPISDLWSPISDLRSPISDLRSPTSDLRSPISDLRPPTSDLWPLSSDKKIYIFRPAMIHGPGNKGNLNLLYNVVAKGIPWPLGAFHNQRSMVSINNLTYIIQQFLEKDISSGIYNIADDYPVSTNEIIQLMAQSMNKSPGIWKLPKSGIQLMARLGDMLQLPLNSERLKKLTESYVVSNEKLKKALGIENLPVDARDGLLRTFGSFR